MSFFSIAFLFAFLNIYRQHGIILVNTSSLKQSKQSNEQKSEIWLFLSQLLRYPRRHMRRYQLREMRESRFDIENESRLF